MRRILPYFHLVEAAGDYGTNPIGTGPFKFVSWQKGTNVCLSVSKDAQLYVNDRLPIIYILSYESIAGGSLGAAAGYYGGRIDNMIMRVMDVLLSIPQTLLAIAIAASLGPGLMNMMIAVGISATPRYARIVRSSVLTIRGMEFIEAAQAVGSSDFRIIMKHIIPNSMAPIIVQSTLGVASAILNAAGLSFIGLGIQPPNPEWGAMLSGGRQYIRDYPHLTLYPGLTIMITILALNFLGDGLRDALDPKQRR